jgi:signal transduction histidine kinase/DNA-binding response OmpR family regulator
MFLLSFPLYLYQYQTGWIWGLMLFPILVFLESGRIALIAERNKISGARVVTYGAAAFLVLYSLFFLFHFGLLPVGTNGFWGHVTFNLGVLSLPISLSIYLATEASFTSRSLEAKLLEVEQLWEKNLLQEREKRQWQETDEIKSRFFANISHEFRTPLSLIRGTVEKLRKKDEADSPRQADYGAIDRSAGSLLQMINQLLDLSRLESGKLSLHLEPANLSELLKVLAGSFSSLFESKGITYRYTIPLQPVWVHLDREKLEHIINNLLSNAAKFTPADGQVNFLATLESTPDRKCNLQIQVQDTGIGISAAHLPRIFDRFYQTDNSLTRQYEGTGIGLALVKELVELHGGKIGVDSTQDEGSTFTVALLFNPAQEEQVTRNLQSHLSKDAFSPLAVETAVPDPDRLPERNHSRSVHILVVEDNKDLRHFLTQCLSENYQVREAGNGLEGYKKATELLPDLIISDIMMPGIDGITLCRKLKEDERTGHIPVILLTAKAEAHSKISGLDVGADDYLTKPFSTEELMHRVSNLIWQRQQLKGKFSRLLTIQPTQIAITSADEQFLQKVMYVVEENIANPDFDVDAFSRELGMSRTQLNRKLTAMVEQSPNEFIRTMRLKRAAALLAGQQSNVGEIAFMVGFSNPNYFTKCFRDYYGLAPTEYVLTGKITEENKS